MMRSGLGSKASMGSGGRPALGDECGRRLEPRRRPRQGRQTQFRSAGSKGMTDQQEQEEKWHGELLSDKSWLLILWSQFRFSEMSILNRPMELVHLSI